MKTMLKRILTVILIVSMLLPCGITAAASALGTSGANTELIPAWRIIQTQKQDNSTSLYQHFINCCNVLGIPGVEEFLDRMITLDYIIANEDRNLNNFGAIRNAETLEWIGMAPIYDSGSSLGYF